MRMRINNIAIIETELFLSLSLTIYFTPVIAATLLKISVLS